MINFRWGDKNIFSLISWLQLNSVSTFGSIIFICRFFPKTIDTASWHLKSQSHIYILKSTTLNLTESPDKFLCSHLNFIPISLSSIYTAIVGKFVHTYLKWPASCSEFYTHEKIVPKLPSMENYGSLFPYTGCPWQLSYFQRLVYFDITSVFWLKHNKWKHSLFFVLKTQLEVPTKEFVGNIYQVFEFSVKFYCEMFLFDKSY